MGWEIMATVGKFDTKEEKILAYFECMDCKWYQRGEESGCYFCQ